MPYPAPLYFQILAGALGMMVDIGLKFLSAPSPPRGWPWGQGHRLRIFIKKSQGQSFCVKFIRPHILKTLWWISFIYGMMVDIGLKLLLAPSPPRGWPWGQGHGLRIFVKKVKVFSSPVRSTRRAIVVTPVVCVCVCVCVCVPVPVTLC